jgi:DNA-binding GntR family transcriptional regulator
MTIGDRRDRIQQDGKRVLWRQVADDLQADITSGRLGPGWKLPPEVDLADSYGVSRVTIRRAIAELAQDELLDVVHGRGTFVTETPPRHDAGQ